MRENTPRTSPSEPNPKLYSPRNLRYYRRVVVSWSHRLAWKVDNTKILGLYRGHITPRHLEIGPADLYFLDNTPAPAMAHQWYVEVLDLNRAPLEIARRKLKERAQITLHEHDVLASPWPLPDASVGSVAMCHVLHCVPGDSLRHKATAFTEAARVLGEDGVFFGSTLLDVKDPYTSNNWLARSLQQAYNHPRRNIFHNTGDRLLDLRAMLDLHFSHVELRVMGSAGVWVAREPRR